MIPNLTDVFIQRNSLNPKTRHFPPNGSPKSQKGAFIKKHAMTIALEDASTWATGSPRAPAGSGFLDHLESAAANTLALLFCPPKVVKQQRPRVLLRCSLSPGVGKGTQRPDRKFQAGGPRDLSALWWQRKPPERTGSERGPGPWSADPRPTQLHRGATGFNTVRRPWAAVCASGRQDGVRAGTWESRTDFRCSQSGSLGGTGQMTALRDADVNTEVTAAKTSSAR